MNQQDRIFLESVVARALYAMTDDVSLFLESKSSLPMLFEELEQDDMSKLSTQVEDARKDLDELVALLGDNLERMPNTKKMLAKISKNLPKGATIAALNLMGSKKDIAGKVSQAAIAIDSVNSARTSILNAVVLLSTELGKLQLFKDILKKSDTDPEKRAFDGMPPKEFLATFSQLAKEIPSSKSIATGIERSYKAPKEPPGWMGKAVDMFGGMLGLKKFPKLSAKQFKSDMMALPFGSLMALGKKSQGAAQAASNEATQDTSYVTSLGQSLQQTTGGGDAAAPTTAATGGSAAEALKTDQEGLSSIGTELVDAVGKANAQAFVDVVSGKRKLEDLPQMQQKIVSAALSQFGESSKEEGVEPADAADEVAQAAEEEQENVLQFPNIEKLAALGKQRFGDNGDTLIMNFFTDDRVKKAFGISESFTLESLLFEAEEDEVKVEVEFDELFPIAQEVGDDLEPDVVVDEEELSGFFDAAEEQGLLPATVKKARKLNPDEVYEYTSKKGNKSVVKVVGPAEKEGLVVAHRKKKDGTFSKDTYALSMSGFGDQINESNFLNRWNVLAGVA